MTRMFIAETPIATCNDMLGIPAFRRGEPCDEIQSLVTKAIETRTREEKAAFICLKEFNRIDDARFNKSMKKRFLKCRSPDATYVYTGLVESDDFVTNITSSYRNMRKRRKKTFEKSGLE